MSSWQPALGAIAHGDATRFRVWAPEVECVEVMLETPGREVNGLAPTRGPDGFHQASVPSVTAGDLYRYRPDGRGPFPDPASRFQPQGVHGPSQVVDWRHFPWTDEEWPGVPLEGAAFYELHPPIPMPAPFKPPGPIEFGRPGAVIFWSLCAVVEEE